MTSTASHPHFSATAPRRPRVAVAAGLPVQYQTPFFAYLTSQGTIDLTVLYFTSKGLEGSGVQFAEFGQPVVWDVDLLSGYKHKFLRNPIPVNGSRPWSVITPEVMREVSPTRYDVLVNCGWQYPANVLATAAAARARVPMLMYTDTDVRDSGTGRHPWLRRALLPRLLGSAAGALYTGTFNRDFYIRAGFHPDRLWFSPWAVDNGRYRTRDRDASRARLGLRAGTTYFIFVGSLSPRKNVDALLRGLSQLQTEGRRVGALIAGTGAEESSLRSLTDELRLRDVRWLGFVNQTDLPGCYAAADVFVLPSWSDPRATVVNEAMASGLPVVVSSGTGVWGPGDLVRHGSEGFVFNPADPRELAARCRELLDEEVRRRMGAAAELRVSSKWCYEVAAEGWNQAARALTNPAPDGK